MITLLIYFVVIVILLAVAYYAVTALLPEPVQKFAMVVLVLVGALAVVWLLLQATGHGGAFGGNMPSLR